MMPTFPKGHNSRHTFRQNQKAVFKKLDAEISLNSCSTTTARRELSEADRRDRTVIWLISRDGDRCYLCGRQRHHCDYEIEHIIPRAHGGEDDLTNLALACKPCNARKGDRIISFAIKDRTPCYSLAPYFLPRWW